jgi:cell division protein FtsL
MAKPPRPSGSSRPARPHPARPGSGRPGTSARPAARASRPAAEPRETAKPAPKPEAEADRKAAAPKATAAKATTAKATAAKATAARATSARANATKPAAPAAGWRARARGRGLRLTRRGLVLVLVAFMLSVMAVYPLRQYVTQQQRINQLQAKQEALAAEVARLEREKARLRDPEYVEQLAREELQMAKPGEETYVMAGNQPADQPVAAATPQAPKRPWYKRFWDKVLGRAG